jgi:hypothetical protein
VVTGSGPPASRRRPPAWSHRCRTALRSGSE